MYYQKLINFNPCKKEYFMSFKLRSLTLAVATFSAMTAHSAGLDRSGQDITGFLQDGDYADIIYTHIDADVKGKDTAGREVKDIAPSYDFFRYNVKSDVNDRVSVGVLYDEPFGAKVQYEGVNNFTGAANGVAQATIARILSDERISRLSNQATVLRQESQKALQNNRIEEAQAYTMLSLLVQGTSQTLKGYKDKVDNGTTPQQIVTEIEQSLQTSQKLRELLLQPVKDALETGQIESSAKANIENILRGVNKNSETFATGIQTVKNLTADNGGTSVEIHTRNITGLVGVKLGEKKNIQVYGGPAFQKLEGEVHLRGNSYKGATGYDAQITPDTALGWVAGVAYSKPEIALKASLTYRSEIEHDTKINEFQPLATIAGASVNQSIPQRDRRNFKVTTPESYNLDFQTGLSAKHRLLGTLKVRYVPWSDFAITPPLYNQVSKVQDPKGLDIVNYAKDQWSAEIGLGKQVNDKLSVAGNVGWDSGAGNPATSLGPVKGYYSVGLGAKYNITPNWALSAGAKYLKFGDATAQLPTRDTVGTFEKNDGYIVGLKLSYQNK